MVLKVGVGTLLGSHDFYPGGRDCITSFIISLSMVKKLQIMKFISLGLCSSPATKRAVLPLPLQCVLRAWETLEGNFVVLPKKSEVMF